MTVLISYDLSGMWSEVKASALRHGFYESTFLISGKAVQLPNTTLMIDDISARDALDRFVAIVRQTNISINIEKASAVEWSIGYHHEDPPRLGRLGGIR